MTRTTVRKVVAGFSLAAIVYNVTLRAHGEHARIVHSLGDWMFTTYNRRQTSILSSSKVDSKSKIPKDIHLMNIELLELLEWEYACVKEGSPLIRSNETENSRMRQNTSTCQPPVAVVLDCCEGTFASATTVVNFAYQKCEHAFAASQNTSNPHSLPKMARQFLKDHPIVVKSTPTELPQSQQGVVRTLTTNSNLNKNKNSTMTTVIHSNLRCDICQIVEHCRQNNLTMTFVGDSVQAQVWHGLIYELQRRNYRLTLKNNETQAQGFWKTQIQYRETLRITSELWSTHNKEDTTTTAPIVTMKFFQVYILPFEHAAELEEVVNAGDVLVLGWGLHWNYNLPQYPNSVPSKYVASLAEFLSYIQHNTTTTRRPQLVVHRETSAQHFDAVAGDFSEWYVACLFLFPVCLIISDNDRRISDSCACLLAGPFLVGRNNKPDKSPECKAISYDSKITNWRERCVREAARKAGYQYTPIGPNMPPSQKSLSLSRRRRRGRRHGQHMNATLLPKPELVSLPFFNFTSHHYYQHPKEVDGDCTHYCPSPYLYMPLWRTLRLALDRHLISVSI